jgi:hypothetical protein
MKRCEKLFKKDDLIYIVKYILQRKMKKILSLVRFNILKTHGGTFCK